MSTAIVPAWTHEQLQARIDKAVFNAWLGLRLLDWDASGIRLGLKVRPEALGHATLQALHGGILASMVDTACSMAVIVRTGESVFTVDMRVDYLRPATSAEYTVRGEIVRLGRTLATADAHVFAADGKVVASGRAVLQHVAHPGSHTGSGGELPRA
jgi:uncharacterized protein (TIGR00369 family)